jgi:MFS-type transporter involved in bile tolerance (Atg22 family)
VKAAGVLGAASLMGYILSDQGPAFPNDYALLFVLGGGAFFFSAVALALIHEPPPAEDEPSTTYIAWKDFGRHLMRIWQEDSRLRRATLSRILLALCAMAAPFYVLYATSVQSFPIQAIGLFISAQTVGGLLGSLALGRAADRWGARRVIQIGMCVVLTAPLLALLLSLSGGEMAALLRRAYPWIYIAIGVTENLVILGYMNYVLDAAPPGQRTIYMGATNAFSGLGVLGPVLAGWLLGQTSYTVLFAVAIAFGLGALWLALRLPDTRPKAVAPQPDATADLEASTPHPT